MSTIRQPPSTLSPSIDRVPRGALIQAESGLLANELLEEYHSQRQRSTNRSKSYITKPDLLYVKDAKRNVEEKKAEQARKIWKDFKKQRRRRLQDLERRLDEVPDDSAPTPAENSALILPNNSTTTPADNPVLLEGNSVFYVDSQGSEIEPAKLL
jgi:hypothetical protein